MEEIERIVKDIGRQQAENIYYRACHNLFKQLQELVDEASNELLRLHTCEPLTLGGDSLQVHRIAEDLRNSVNRLQEQEDRAQSDLDGLITFHTLAGWFIDISWYVGEGMEEGEFSEAREDLAALKKDYEGGRW